MRKLQVLGGYPEKKGQVIIKPVLGVDNTMFLKKSEKLF
jgi:hypothetical protein